MTEFKRALLVALLAGGMASTAVAKEKPAAAAADATSANAKNLSKPGQAAAVAAQKQDAAGDSAGAIATVKAAYAAGNLNPTDEFFLSQIELGAANKIKDNAALEEAIRKSANSPFLPATEKVKYMRNMAALSLQRKDYAGATATYEQLVQMTPDDAESTFNLALLYRDQKQNQKAVDTLQKAIGAARAKGTKAPETWYQARLQIAYDNKMAAAVTPASVDLVTDYPTSTNWSNVLQIYRDAVPDDDQLNLDVFRLMRALDALGPERVWDEYARISLEKGLPGEARKVIDDGVAAKKLTGTRPLEKEIGTTASGKIAADKASLPGLERDAAKAANGKVALGTGDAYYGYGNYAKAAELYRLAVSKGGVDAATANLRLGAALAQSGDKAGAATALQTVQGGPRQQLAQYWLIHVGGKAS